MQRLFQILTGMLLGGVVAGLVLLIQARGGSDGGEWSGSPVLMGAPAPDFALTAHDGRTVRLSDFRDRVTVIFFGFTHCPDVCPGTMASLARAREQLGAAGDDLQVLFITVDPARDTPDRLRQYLGNFDPDFLGLTGEEAVIQEVADSYGAFFVRRDPAGPPAPVEGEDHAGHGTEAGEEQAGQGAEGAESHAGHVPEGSTPAYMVDHSGRTFVVDRRGELVLTFQPWLEGEGMARDLARLLDR
jgi:protein SCO1